MGNKDSTAGPDGRPNPSQKAPFRAPEFTSIFGPIFGFADLRLCRSPLRLYRFPALRLACSFFSSASVRRMMR